MLHTNHRFFPAWANKLFILCSCFMDVQLSVFLFMCCFTKGKEKDTQQLKNLTAFLMDLHKQCKLFKVAGIFSTKMFTKDAEAFDIGWYYLMRVLSQFLLLLSFFFQFDILFSIYIQQFALSSGYFRVLRYICNNIIKGKRQVSGSSIMKGLTSIKRDKGTNHSIKMKKGSRKKKGSNE